jgi:aspartyl-tRNA(Asn)/glutamyl-tRNA(Gln) amidotransferase subunit C
MAKLSRDDVLKLARLARLHLTDDEVKRYQDELNDILSYVDMLQKTDTKGLEPTSQVTGLTNVMRPDEIVDYGYAPDDLFENLPAHDGRYIKTKRILN